MKNNLLTAAMLTLVLIGSAAWYAGESLAPRPEVASTETAIEAAAEMPQIALPEVTIEARQQNITTLALPEVTVCAKRETGV